MGMRQLVWVVAGLLALSQTAWAQPASKPTSEEKFLTTDDNVELKISYYKSSSGKDAPVVIMLHGKKGTRLQWKGLATELQAKRDFAVVAIDLRGHGESPLKKTELKKGDYQAMVTLDMDAVHTFLLDEHQKGNLNINKQGLVACDFSAAVALAYAEIDWERAPYDDNPNPDLRTPRGQDVRALALISPELTTMGLQTSKVPGIIKNPKVAAMIGASEKNAQDNSLSKKLYEQFATRKDKETIYFEKYPEDVRGMDLILRDSQIRTHITNFLVKYVKEAPSEWRDRRSRLDRE